MALYGCFDRRAHYDVTTGIVEVCHGPMASCHEEQWRYIVREHVAAVSRAWSIPIIEVGNAAPFDQAA
jgi:hypothetical protein